MQTAMIQTYTDFQREYRPMSRPVLPESERWRLEAHQVVSLNKTNGVRISWYPYMTTVEAGNYLITWFKKPTIKDAVQQTKLKPHGDVYIFHTDGSVTARWFGQTYHWPAGEPESYVVSGTIVEPTHFHDGTACYASCPPHYHNDGESCCGSECDSVDGELSSDDE